MKYLIQSIILNIILFVLFYLIVMKPIQTVSQIVAQNWCETLKIECKFK